MKKIPLEKRLGPSCRGGIPRAAWLFVEDYFLCLSDINGGPSYKDYYKKMLWDKQHSYGDIRNTFVAEAAAKAFMAVYPAEKGMELLTRFLLNHSAKKHRGTKGGNRK